MGIKVKTVENESRNEKSEPVRYTSRKSKAKSFGMKARTLDSLNVGHDDDKETAQLRRVSETERLIQAQAQRLQESERMIFQIKQQSLQLMADLQS